MTGHSLNDFELLTNAERELFNDQGIEDAFQTWASGRVKMGQSLNLRRDFIDRLRSLFDRIEHERAEA